MLSTAQIQPVIAVKSLETARNFYENELGLILLDENPAGVYYQTGNGKLFVYVSQYAGTNLATIANWIVEDVDTIVEELAGRGVDFEHYDIPEATLVGNIHVMGDMKAAWFKDPDGNILCISNIG
jgi:catechol 2,3-dioxygenase-like lactoylglutathione lyase family enzyme